MENAQFADTGSEKIAHRTTSWNKGKLTGAKPPLQPKHLWAIRTRLQMAEPTRDLALLNIAIDSKLRGCDVVSLRVEDIAPRGYALDRATIRQRKTGRPVKFEITEQTRQAISPGSAPAFADPQVWPVVEPQILWNNSPSARSRHYPRPSFEPRRRRRRSRLNFSNAHADAESP